MKVLIYKKIDSKGKVKEQIIENELNQYKCLMEICVRGKDTILASLLYDFVELNNNQFILNELKANNEFLSIAIVGKLKNTINHNFVSITMAYYLRLRQYGFKYVDSEDV